MDLFSGVLKSHFWIKISLLWFEITKILEEELLIITGKSLLNEITSTPPEEYVLFERDTNVSFDVIWRTLTRFWYKNCNRKPGICGHYFYVDIVCLVCLYRPCVKRFYVIVLEWLWYLCEEFKRGYLLS